MVLNNVGRYLKDRRHQIQRMMDQLDAEELEASKEADTLRWTEDTLLALWDTTERRRWAQLQRVDEGGEGEEGGDSARGRWRVLREMWEEKKREWEEREAETKEMKERIAESVEELKRVKQQIENRHCHHFLAPPQHNNTAHAESPSVPVLTAGEMESLREQGEKNPIVRGAAVVKGVITWLGCRRDSTRWKEFIVSLESVEKHFNRRYRYPILIFHEDYTEDTFEYLRSFSSAKIEFAQIDLSIVPRR